MANNITKRRQLASLYQHQLGCWWCLQGNCLFFSKVGSSLVLDQNAKKSPKQIIFMYYYKYLFAFGIVLKTNANIVHPLTFLTVVIVIIVLMRYLPINLIKVCENKCFVF